LREVSDDIFIETWRQFPSATTVSQKLGISVRNIFARRRLLETKYGIELKSHVVPSSAPPKISLPVIGEQITIDDFAGTIIVFGDGHFWPNEQPPPAFEALINLINELKPSLVVCNGDSFDGARVSRFGARDYGTLPTVAKELETCQERHAEVEMAAGAVPLIWNMGNHDERFTKRLAQQAGEYANIAGMAIQDHFPAWQFAYSLMINGDLMIKHRFKGGVHATYQNVLHSGISIVASHLHKGQVISYKDYGPRRFGVDPGCISQFGPDSTKFNYAEGNPKNWTEGLAFLTVDDDKTLWPPELVTVLDNRKAVFRGRAVN
jgi:hypothetical protein